MSRTCDSCGARLREDAERCDLCGMKAGESPDEYMSDAADDEKDVNGVGGHDTDVGDEPAGVFCNKCGWRNPAGANFCSRCGAKLQAVSGREAHPSDARSVESGSAEARPGALAPSRPPSPDPDAGSDTVEEADSTAGMGRQVVVIVGAGILFVIALYMITVLSADTNGSNAPARQSPAAATVDVPPLAEQFVPRETELQDRLAAASGAEALDIRRDLMDLYLAANRIDLAAAEAERIAEVTNTENDWAIAGNLYYDVMEGRQDASQSVFAKRAIAAYGRALEVNPDNLDVRTDMAIAYMYDPDNPMMAIQETNRVLEQDSLHIQANFNRGVMLANINRIDQAVEQFEKVKRIIGDDSNPIYQRADQAIESVQGAGR